MNTVTEDWVFGEVYRHEPVSPARPNALIVMTIGPSEEYPGSAVCVVLSDGNGYAAGFTGSWSQLRTADSWQQLVPE